MGLVFYSTPEVTSLSVWLISVVQEAIKYLEIFLHIWLNNLRSPSSWPAYGWRLVVRGEDDWMPEAQFFVSR
ncbi:MAG: hypothetical protein CMM47_02185 [Rhodospirillaceae bacterium]|nr:hypothetical protein [Rhodospirillaceae bacterium]